MTSSTALRLARFFGTSSAFWINLQLRWDLFHAERLEADQVQRIQPHHLSEQCKCRGLKGPWSQTVRLRFFLCGLYSFPLSVPARHVQWSPGGVPDERIDLDIPHAALGGIEWRP